MIHFIKVSLVALLGIVHQTNLVIAGDGEELQELFFIDLRLLFGITLINGKETELVNRKEVIIE